VPVPICKSEKGAVTVLYNQSESYELLTLLKKDAVRNFVTYNQTIFWIVKLQKGVKSSSAEK
jgi:hypothetical protein